MILVKADLEDLTERGILKLRNRLTGLNKGFASSVNNYAVAERKKGQTNKSIFGFIVWNGSMASQSIQRPMQLIIAYNDRSVNVLVPSDDSSLENLCVDVAATKFPYMGNKKSVAVVEYTQHLLEGKRQIVSIA